MNGITNGTDVPVVKNLWSETPLIYSHILSSRASCNVWLKLETVQPSGSFKNRGIGNLVSYYDQLGSTHFVAWSGGNAGLAAAYSARQLKARCSVFVPSTTLSAVVQRLKIFGADVIVAGDNLDDARDACKLFVANTPNCVFIPPFDHPKILEGHASLVHEIKQQLQKEGVTYKPAAIICSVGGGGLIGGVAQGLQEADWEDVTIIGCETAGCASLALSLRQSYATTPPTLVTPILPHISTIASSLGSKIISRDAMELLLEQDHQGGVVSVVMEDVRTVGAAREYANDHATLLEPACSCSLAPLYTPSIIRACLPDLKFPTAAPPSPPLEGQTPDEHRPQAIEDSPDVPLIVVIVCGGNTATLERLLEWEDQFAEQRREQGGDGPVSIFSGKGNGIDITM